MGSLLQPTPVTTGDDRNSNWLAIVFGVGLVVIVAVIGSLLLRTDAKIANPPHPYAANIKFSDLKMSAAENFVGSTVTYLDGTATNSRRPDCYPSAGERQLQRFTRPDRSG